MSVNYSYLETIRTLEIRGSGTVRLISTRDFICQQGLRILSLDNKARKMVMVAGVKPSLDRSASGGRPITRARRRCTIDTLMSPKHQLVVNEQPSTRHSRHLSLGLPAMLQRMASLNSVVAKPAVMNTATSLDIKDRQLVSEDQEQENEQEKEQEKELEKEQEQPKDNNYNVFEDLLPSHLLCLQHHHPMYLESIQASGCVNLIIECPKACNAKKLRIECLMDACVQFDPGNVGFVVGSFMCSANMNAKVYAQNLVADRVSIEAMDQSTVLAPYAGKTVTIRCHVDAQVESRKQNGCFSTMQVVNGKRIVKFSQ